MVEEKLTNLYRQGKVVGGLYRSLGQEACSVGAAYALERGDIFTPAHPQPGRDLRARRPAARRALPVHGARGGPTRRPRPQHPLRLARARTAACRRSSPCSGDMVPILAGAALAERMQGRADRRAHLDRRRRDVDRRLPRGPQLRLRAEGAARADRREQQVGLLDAHVRKQTANTALRGPRPGLRLLRRAAWTATTCWPSTRSRAGPSRGRAPARGRR